MTDAGEQPNAVHLGELGDLVERLSAVAQKTGLATLNVKTTEFRIELTTGLAKAPRRVEHVTTSGPQTAMSSDSVPVVDVASKIDGYVVTSPMVGTFYRATSPTEPALVEKSKNELKKKTKQKK